MDSIKQKDRQIEANQTLKNVTWKESGVPTLTQQALVPEKEVIENDGYPDDFILEFDATPTQKNGHQLNCTCKACVAIPKSDKIQFLGATKAELCSNMLNKKRY